MIDQSNLRRVDRRQRRLAASPAMPALLRSALLRDALLRAALLMPMLAGAVLAGAGLAACAVVAPTAPASASVAVAPQWHGAHPAAGAAVTPLAAWWRRFQDPMLVDLIDAALRHNTSILGARAVLAQSRALAAVQAAASLPVVNSTVSAQRSRAGDVETSNFKAGFDASWELDVFGGQRAALQAAHANARADAADLANVQVSVAAEVALNYLTLRALQARLDIASGTLRSQEETLKLTGWRMQAGLLSTLENDQARAATEQTRARIPALLAAATQAENMLALLVGQAAGALHDRLAAPAAAAATAAEPGELVLAVPAATLRQRPDVRAAEARMSAAAASVAQADAARLPDFSLGGSLGVGALTVAALPNAASVVAALLARMGTPIFDAGAGRGRVAARQAALEQAGAAYAAVVLGALKEVEDQLASLDNDRSALQSLRLAAAAARNAALLASQRYRSGLVDFQLVLETQRSSFATEDAVAVAAASLQADHVRLYKALGGGWDDGVQRAAPAAAFQ